MKNYREFLFGSRESFAITGKQWLDEHQTRYIFGEFYFACGGNIIGDEQTIVLNTARISLENIMSRYDHAIAEELAEQSIENIEKQLYDICVKNYENHAYEERVERHETLFLTLNICESLDGAYLFLISSRNSDLLLYSTETANSLSHLLLPSGHVFSIFKEYIAFIDDLMKRHY